MESFQIFISFSGKFSQEIAEELKHWIHNYDRNLMIHVSSEDLDPGVNWEKELDQLLDSDYGILVLTRDNLNSPWLLFEAGSAAKNKTRKVCPILFGRDKDNIEAPISKFNYLQFTEENNFEFSKEQMQRLLSTINEMATKDDHKAYRRGWEAIERHMENTWDGFKDNISAILEKYRFSHPSKVRHDVKVTNHLDINLSVDEVFEDYKNVSINEIPHLLANYLKHGIDSSYQILYPEYSSNTVIINQTRISTFIAFTDEKNILVFERQLADTAQTQVKSDSIDVFGSVQFENRTIFAKIAKDDFAKSKILKIEYIPGFAVEDNVDKSRKRETVIMIGYAVFVSEEDLKKGVNGKTTALYKINDRLLRQSKNLTSKAKLAVTYLNSRLHSES
ncbi:MAG: TIR domain-containing protein [Methylococcales bacterium]